MKWKTLESESIFSAGFFQLRSDRCELPDGRVMPRYFVLDFPDWVNVVPVTKDGQFIMVRQYRHASQEVHIELPGGSMDPGSDLSPEEGALRELSEETGYTSKSVELIHSHFPNPALQSNQMHTFLALDCEKTEEQKFDAFEDLEVYLCSPQQLLKHLENNEITHTIMIASIYKALEVLKARNLFNL